MHRLTLPAALVLLSASTPAWANFEGVLEMEMKAGAGSGAMKIFVGKSAVRNEMSITARDIPVRMIVLFKKETPNVAYSLDEANKAYAELDLARARQMRPDQKFTAKKLPAEKVGSWDCQHALLTDENGDETEVWTNNGIMDTKAFLSAVGQHGPANESMMKALKSVGADGFVVKLVHRPKANPAAATTLLLTKAEKKKLEKSLFEIPADYKKAHTPVPPTPSGGIPPEVQKQIEEQLKNMTPEQREMLRKLQEGQPPAPPK